MNEFVSPTIEYAALAPVLLVSVVGLIGVVLEAFLGPAARRAVQPGLALAGLVGALILLVVVAAGTPDSIGAAGATAYDGVAYILQGSILVLAFSSALLAADRTVASSFAAAAEVLPGTAGDRAAVRSEREHTEVWPLIMFAVAGMLLFVSANDLLMAFIALEVMSLPLYLLVGLARRRRLLSQEAAMKYFLLGAFSSAFFLYGVAMLYGFSGGSFTLGAIRDAVTNGSGSEPLLLLGMALLAVGLLFKVGAVPFHSWTPDVYQGAPTPITAFMAATVKVASFGALLRIFLVAFEPSRWEWRPVIWGAALASMVVGSLLAIAQKDVKRMLAYSSIAHSGFLLAGIAATTPEGIAATLFYLIAYGFATVGTFAVVTLVRDGGGEATHLSRWAGLGRRSPLLAGVFALFLLALAGIPLTSGFTGKFAVFSAAAAGGAVPLVVVGVLASAVAAFFYVRVIVLMFFQQPAADGPTVVLPGAATAAALALGATVTVVLGLVPQPLLDLVTQAGALVR